MVADRLLSRTVPVVVAGMVVTRGIDAMSGRRSRSTRKSGGAGGAGGGGVTHYPANRIKTLCGKKLKDVDHTRVRKNVDCKKCKKLMGRSR